MKYRLIIYNIILTLPSNISNLVFTFCGLVTSVHIEMLQRKHILSS